ncbi:MAG: CCA tRNA nucleotidyltransferase [Verrucomicrobiota bacterium]
MNGTAATNLRPSALAIVNDLRRAGFTAYWAGGCVRDMLMGREPKDYDIATSASPDQVAALFPKTLDVGKAFGVLHVLRDGQPFEVATFRCDLAYEDGRRPSGVTFGGPEEDALRRDFTVNGLFYDPADQRILDYVHGQEDIQARILRTIGRPEERFGEDYLRMLRAVRLASVLEFALDPAAAAAIRGLAARIAGVSAERIQQELTRLLVEAPRPGQGLVLLRDVGLLAVLLPEADRMAGQEQPPAFHPEGDVFTHTVRMLDTMKNPTVTLAYAVLLHDVGKPATASTTREPDGTDRIRFNEHAKVGAVIAEEILRRLRLPQREIEAVTYCIRNHMRFLDVQRMRRSTLRQLVGAPTFPVELELHRLDCIASHGDLGNYEFLLRFVAELKSEPALPAPWVTGHDLMALGLPEGRQIGLWHKKAYEAQIEGRFPNREELLQWLRQELARTGREREDAS